MKKIFSLLTVMLTLSLLLGILAGCTQEPDTQPEESTADQTTESDDTTQPPEPAELTITEGENGATVQTPTGLSYLATGYQSVGNDTFTFTKGLLLDLCDAFAGEFNRFTIRYTASAPMRMTVTYTEKGEQLDDLFFLEAGEHEFSALNSKFMNKTKGSSITSIQIDPCQGESAEFLLTDLTVQTIAVPQAQQNLVGTRYTVGVDLKWGGAINCVEDTQCPIEGVTNICNKHDEGRLIQQSYYGVFYRESEYVEGGYLGLEGVAYNPVQGGDVSGRDSRLIDFEIGEDYIYVKAQPLDWPLKDSLTPSYMENKYEVKDDYIQVFNRFIDFSGWEHPALNQELPAAYTVNTLDTFVWYDGAKPWTGEELSYINDWSEIDPVTGKSSHVIVLKEPNDESWCALIDSDTNYGLGIYVPNSDRFLAMRYLSGQKGDTQAKGNPCSYMCPINKLTIVSYQPIEYSYLLAAGTPEEIREVFSQNRDFDPNKGFDVKHPSRAPYEEE